MTAPTYKVPTWEAQSERLWHKPFMCGHYNDPHGTNKETGVREVACPRKCIYEVAALKSV